MKTCGSNIPAKMTSTGNKMTVKFKSDSYISLKGFRATWRKIATDSKGKIMEYLISQGLLKIKL